MLRRRLVLGGGATPSRYGGAITIALAYGLRLGEVLGLRRQNLDWEAGTLRLTHAVKRDQGAGQEQQSEDPGRAQ